MIYLSDTDLLVLLEKDSHSAYGTILKKYWEELYEHVCIKIKDREEAQDIVQEIFFSFWKNRFTIHCDDQGRLSSYLYKAAKYACINYFSRPGITISGAKVLDDMLNHPSSAQTDEKVLLNELHRLVDKELNQLPDRLQMPYRLSREQHMSVKEIAAYLSISEQTVKNNISAVLQRIRVRLGQYNSDFTAYLLLITFSL